MAKQVDARDLKSLGVFHASSILAARTNLTGNEMNKLRNFIIKIWLELLVFVFIECFLIEFIGPIAVNSRNDFFLMAAFMCYSITVVFAIVFAFSMFNQWINFQKEFNREENSNR